MGDMHGKLYSNPYYGILVIKAYRLTFHFVFLQGSLGAYEGAAEEAHVLAIGVFDT